MLRIRFWLHNITYSSSPHIFGTRDWFGFMEDYFSTDGGRMWWSSAARSLTGCGPVPVCSRGLGTTDLQSCPFPEHIYICSLSPSIHTHTAFLLCFHTKLFKLPNLVYHFSSLVLQSWCTLCWNTPLTRCITTPYSPRRSFLTAHSSLSTHDKCSQSTLLHCPLTTLMEFILITYFIMFFLNFKLSDLFVAISLRI